MANSKILLTAWVLTLLLSLLGAISHPHPAIAIPDEVKWSRVNIPIEGEAGNWVLASGSNIQHLTMAVDGTLYCYANPSGTSYTLFKSTDAGSSWSHAGMVTDVIVDIATAPDDASIVYYATPSNIYKSTDAGNSFSQLPPNPGGAGSGNITITSIDVAPLDGDSIIAVGTRDSDDTQYGGVYTLDESEPSPDWTNTNIGNYDVSALAFSPNFPADQQLVAVATDEQDTIVSTRIGNADWGTVFGDATIESLLPVSAAIAFPGDYDATTENYTLFMAFDTGTGNGDVYRVKGIWTSGNSTATDLDIGSADNLSGVDVTGLAVRGNTASASLLAGSANSTQVYISTDSGLTWTRSGKEPTGQSKTDVLMAPDFSSSGLAYTVTSGTESAFSYTTDGGVNWNQISLIDTKIGENGIIDLAISPRYRYDDTLFLLTFDGEHIEHSLWRSLNGGAKWERVFTSTVANEDSLNLVELSPQYDSSSQVVFLAGNSGNSTIWKSVDNGQAFTPRSSPFPIDIWTVVNDNSLFLGSYNGTNGLVYRTTDSGLSYSTGTVAGSQPLKSIVLSPNYEQDGTLLVGNSDGWVYWSEGNGTRFKPLPPDATSPPFSGNIIVAFDPEFSNNKTVYAASDTETTAGSEEGIYRFVIDRNTAWESIDGTLPVGSKLNQLAVSADGALYTTNLMADGGMERSLNPTYSLNPTFETVTRGLDDGATLTGLWLQHKQLWSIDSKNTRLMTYTDSLSKAVRLGSPYNKAPGIDTKNINLEWATLKGATEYQWQLDYETNFSSVPDEFEDNTKGTSTRLPALEPATTYYWRVRATKPVLSPWSAKWSFTTVLGGITVVPELLSPKAGVSEVPLKPVFQWSAIAGADSYELLVSTDVSFANSSIVKTGDYALPATAWQSDTSLDYNTTYYWKVRAAGSNSYSAWSAVGAFTIESPPDPSPEPPPDSSPAELPSAEAPPEPSPEPSPEPPPESSPLEPSLAAAAAAATPSPEPSPPSPLTVQLAVPNWAIYIVVALLLTTVLLVVTILALVVRMKRP